MMNKTDDFLSIEWATVSEDDSDAGWPEQAAPTEEELEAQCREAMAQRAAWLAEEDARHAEDEAWLAEHADDEHDEPC